VSYSYSLTPADKAEVINNVERALAVGEIPAFRARYTELENLETSLSPAVNALRANRSEIAAPLFEGPPQVGGGPVSADDLKVCLGKMYSAFLSNYKALVDTNFPTLRSHFRLYSQLPLSVYLVLGTTVDRGFGFASTPLSVYFVKAGLRQSVVQVVEEVIWEPFERGVHCTVGGVVHEGISWLSTTVENLFASRSALEWGRFRGMTLRALVYSTLREELSAVEDAFRSQFRLSKSSRYPGLK
jgi:hypothetical protein